MVLLFTVRNVTVLHALRGLKMPQTEECWCCTIHIDCYSVSEPFMPDPVVHSSYNMFIMQNCITDF